MKVKHTKLKKSIFLILICISLTTTFVVSASAEGYSSYTVSLYLNDTSNFIGSFKPYYYGDSVHSEFIISYFDSSFDTSILPFPILPYESFFVFDSFDGDFYFSFGLNSLTSFYSSYNDSYNVIDYFSVPDIPGGYSFIGEIPVLNSDSYIIFYSDSSPSFTDSVGSGLTSSLSWVGQVVESLTTGPIKPLLECFAVTISVSALLLGIYSIRRFIWGS